MITAFDQESKKKWQSSIISNRELESSRKKPNHSGKRQRQAVEQVSYETK